MGSIADSDYQYFFENWDQNEISWIPQFFNHQSKVDEFKNTRGRINAEASYIRAYSKYPD